MKALRILAIVSFVAGTALLVAGLVRQSDSGGRREEAEPFVELEATPATTPPPVTTPVSQAATPGQPTPTPTPPPFDGAVTRLKIPKFSVDSSIETIGLLPTNELDTPKDPHNTGWYDIYDKPGFRGNAVFSAHVDYYPNIRGPFYNLAKLELEDQIVVGMENGEEYRYRVIKRKRYEVSTIPMGDLIWPKDKPEGSEWITLITCGGRFQESRPGGPGEYLDRDVIVAERIQ